MRNSQVLLAGAGLVAALAWSPVAFGHTYIQVPARRDANKTIAESDGHKGAGSMPCGGVAKTMPTQYMPGQTVKLEWGETIDHQGCFQWAISSDNDTTFIVQDVQPINCANNQLIGAATNQVNDPVDTAPAPSRTTPLNRCAQLTLPSTPCANCTLQLRQLMIGRACVANEPAPPTTTYVSCADIRIGTFTDAGPVSTSSSSSSSSGSPGTVDPDPDPDADASASASSSGGKKTTRATSDGNETSSCSLGAGPTAGLFSFGAFALGLRRRRRRD